MTKNFRKKYEFMVNGFVEFLRDMEQWRYVRLEKSIVSGNYINRMIVAVEDMVKYYPYFEKFITSKEVNRRAEEIWIRKVCKHSTTVGGMGKWNTGVTDYNIPRTLNSFKEIFDIILGFFGYSNDIKNPQRLKIGNSLKENLEILNNYFQNGNVWYSGYDNVIWFLIALGNIARDMYLQTLPDRVAITTDEFDSICYAIENMDIHPEYHTPEDDEYIRNLPYNKDTSIWKLLNRNFCDTEHETMLVPEIKGLSEIVNKLEDMEERWKSSYNKENKSKDSGSNAFAYRMEESYDIMSD